MRNWREEAEAVLASVHASLPADADLVTRREACLRAKPWEFQVTSWGRKVWQKAQRAYLERHGLPKRVIPIEQMESPLERAARRAGAK